MPQIFWVSRLACLLGLTFLLGCGGEPRPVVPDTVPFTGKVTLDGKPLKGATVLFIATVKSKNNAGANTNDAGEYQLNTAVGQVKKTGAVPGSYKVTIDQIGFVTDPTQPPKPGGLPLPPRYSDAGKTELKATIPDNGGSQDFELKSK